MVKNTTLVCMDGEQKMKFFKTKIAILILLMYITPCIIGISFSHKIGEKKINVWDINNKSVIQLNVNDYLIGVVAAEMPVEFETEALKAQAVAARTYLINKGRCEKNENCDICTDPGHCQAYKSPTQLKKQWGSNYYKYYKKVYNAVYSTNNKIIVYNNQPISAVFHSTSSGRTENSDDVWSKQLPYLKSVDSNLDVMSPKYNSQKIFTLENFQNILSDKKGVNFIDKLIGDITYTTGGSVKTIEIGDKTLKGTEIRSLFDLNSANFSVEINNDNVYFNVKGYGHGVGMSQYGANFMAQNGDDYIKILKKYYTDTDIVNTDYAYIAK